MAASKQPDLDRESGEPTPGSFEWHDPHPYTSCDPGPSRKRTHTVSPGLTFRTDVTLFETFVRMLEILKEVDFIWVHRYSGPSIFFQVPPGGTAHIDTPLIALDLYDGETSIPMSGLKARLLYDHGTNVIAKLDVGGSGRTKVKLRVKGTMGMTDWKDLQGRVGKGFKPSVSPRA